MRRIDHERMRLLRPGLRGHAAPPWKTVTTSDHHFHEVAAQVMRHAAAIGVDVHESIVRDATTEALLAMAGGVVYDTDDFGDLPASGVVRRRSMMIEGGNVYVRRPPGPGPPRSSAVSIELAGTADPEATDMSKAPFLSRREVRWAATAFMTVIWISLACTLPADLHGDGVTYFATLKALAQNGSPELSENIRTQIGEQFTSLAPDAIIEVNGRFYDTHFFA